MKMGPVLPWLAAEPSSLLFDLGLIVECLCIWGFSNVGASVTAHTVPVRLFFFLMLSSCFVSCLM